jgi:hypothetical protein
MTNSWNSHGFANLADSVDMHGEDPNQTLEIQRHDIYFIGPEPRELKERVYDLRIYVGDDDLSFSGLSARKVCEIAEDLIRLVGGSLRVDPPADPEIKF